MNELKSIVIIPARFDSSRFPGKPLAKIADKPMIQHVYERASRARGVGSVLVATDDPRIEQAVLGFGGKACLTSRQHRSGTDRVAEAAKASDAKVVVNLQGDEPLIDPGCIESILAPFLGDPDLMISTAKAPILSMEEWESPNVVKVVTDLFDCALYFSRLPIPFVRDRQHRLTNRWEGAFKHIGIYAYRKEFLERLPALRPSFLESAEELEQLRFLDNGFRIKVVLTEYQSIGVDTVEDLNRVQAILESDDSLRDKEPSWQPNSSL